MILKRNFLLVLLVLVFSNNLKAQVGINTTTPASSLDVVGEPTIVTTSDGILAPRITGDQLRAKTAYGADQEGALIYVTVADSAPAGQTINVTASGYYYFDGLVWQANNVAVGTAENIYTTDGTLTTNRAVTQNNFDLNFDANTLVISGDDNRVGLGTITPRARLEISGAPAVGATIPPLTDDVTPASTEYSVVISNSDNATVGTVQGFSTASGGFDSYLQARNFVSGDVYNLLLNPLGANVGIGTTIPTQRLTIDGNITTVQDGQRILFPHSNAVDGNDGTIGSDAFAEGLNIVGTQTVAGNGRRITTFGDVVHLNNVGIGNVVPTSALDVNGATRVRNIPVGTAADIVITADADGNLRQRTAAQIVAAGGGIDADGDAWGVTGEDITSNIGRTGNVGIGTTTPRAGLELSKTPAIGATVRPLSEAVNVANSSNYNLVLSNSDNATVGAVSGFSTEAGGFNTYLQARGFATNGPAYNLLLNPLGANVGIGTTIPTQRLTIDGNITTVQDGQRILFPHSNAVDGNDGTIGSGAFEEGLNIVGTQTVAGNGRRITTLGTVVHQNNVGIGNVVPTSFLDVNGDARVRNIPAGVAADGILTTDANGNIRQRTAAQIVAAGGGNDADGDAWGVTGEDIVSNIGRTGNVGIGITVPTQRLQVDGNQTFTSDGNFLRFPNTNQTDGNDGIISAGLFQEGLNIVGVQTVAGNGRRITTFGDVVHLNNVGIGNVVPTSALDVNGTTRVRNIPAGVAADIVITADADGNIRQRTAAQIVAAGGGIDADGDAWGVTGEDITSNIGRTGNVGIGTTTPRAGLELSKTAAIGATARPLTEAVDVANSDNYNFVLSNSDNATVGAVSGFSTASGGFDTYFQTRGFAANGPAYNLLFNPVGGNVGVNNVNPVSPFTVGITSNGSRFMGDARIGNANGDTRAALVVGEDSANNGYIVINSSNSNAFGQEIQMISGVDNGNSDFMRMRSTNLDVSLQGALRSGGGNDSEFNLTARNNIVTLSGDSNGGGSAINFVGANIGIDNTNPTASVDINGDARVRNIPAGAAADNILTTDANGNIRQRTLAEVAGAGADGDAWAVTGEDITTAIGRTGRVGIGTTTPTSPLEVIGAAKINNHNINSNININQFGGTGSIAQLNFFVNGTFPTAKLVKSAGLNSDFTFFNTGIGKMIFNNKGDLPNDATSMAIHNSGITINLDDLVLPGASLDVNGDALFRRGGSVADFSTTATQLQFGFAGSNTFKHSLRTRHNAGGDNGNAIDFYVWDQGTDAQDAQGTKRVLTLDGTGNNGVVQVLGNLTVAGTGTVGGAAITSDRRLKTNITSVANGLDIVSALNPVKYDKKQAINATDYTMKEYGFIAQELREVLPILVSEDSSEDKMLAVNYTALIPILTKATQELKAEAEELSLHTIEQNKEITEIKKENKALRNELDDLKKVVKLLLEGKQ